MSPTAYAGHPNHFTTDITDLQVAECARSFAVTFALTTSWTHSSSHKVWRHALSFVEFWYTVSQKSLQHWSDVICSEERLIFIFFGGQNRHTFINRKIKQGSDDRIKVMFVHRQWIWCLEQSSRRTVSAASSTFKHHLKWPSKELVLLVSWLLHFVSFPVYRPIAFILHAFLFFSSFIQIYKTQITR